MLRIIKKFNSSVFLTEGLLVFLILVVLAATAAAAGVLLLHLIPLVEGLGVSGDPLLSRFDNVAVSCNLQWIKDKEQ